MISRDTIDKIFASLQVEDIVGDFVSLKKRGVNLLGLCPFHDEKTPSFTVSPTKNIFKCFGCGRGGSGVDFLMEHEGMTYPEALRYIANKYGIQIEEKEASLEEQQAKNHLESLHVINQFAHQFYENALYETAEGRSVGLTYLKKRGIIHDTAKTFGLGYAQGGSQSMVHKALIQGYKKEFIQELGLMNKKGGDFFFQRLIFPIHNLSGKVIAFAGRQFGKTDRGPKYLNSPQNPVYNKSKVLYGLHIAKKHIRQHDECILTEGYMDVISLHQSGIRNCVASSGTALTLDQAKLIKRFSQKVCILYDSDVAGIKATIRSVGILLETGLVLSILLLPEGEDPDSFVQKNGPSAFEDYKKEHQKDFILFLADFYTKESQNDPIARTNAVKEIVQNLAKISDNVARSFYVKECSRILDISERILVDEINLTINQGIKQKRLQNLRMITQEKRQMDELVRNNSEPAARQQDKTSADHIQDEIVIQERDIARVLIQFGNRTMPGKEEVSVADFIIPHIQNNIDAWQSTSTKKLISVVIENHQNGQLYGEQHYLNHENADIKKTAIDLLFSPFEYSSNWLEKWDMPLQNQKPPDENFEKDVVQSLRRFNLKQINKTLKIFEERLHTPEIIENAEELLIQMTMYSKLLQDRNQMAEELRTTLP